MPKYLMLLRDTGEFPADLSPEEIQRIIDKYRKWGEKLGRRSAK